MPAAYRRAPASGRRLNRARARKYHARETDRGGIAVRRTETRRSDKTDMSRAVRPHTSAPTWPFTMARPMFMPGWPALPDYRSGIAFQPRARHTMPPISRAAMPPATWPPGQHAAGEYLADQWPQQVPAARHGRLRAAHDSPGHLLGQILAHQRHHHRRRPEQHSAAGPGQPGGRRRGRRGPGVQQRAAAGPADCDGGAVILLGGQRGPGPVRLGGQGASV